MTVLHCPLLAYTGTAANPKTPTVNAVSYVIRFNTLLSAFCKALQGVAIHNPALRPHP